MGEKIWSALMVQGGCIRLYVRSNYHFNSPIELWMMKRDGDWMRVSTYKGEFNNLCLQPLHLMRDGNWLMQSTYNGYLYKVDMKKKRNGGALIIYTVKGIEERRYIRTFLSPNQYMN